MPVCTTTSGLIKWNTADLDVTLRVNDDGVICLHRLAAPGAKETPVESSYFADSDLPLISVRLVGEGNTDVKTAKSLIGSYSSARLKYQSHEASSDASAEKLQIACHDDVSGIHVVLHFTVYVGAAMLRSYATVTNTSKESKAIITRLSPLTIGGLTTGSKAWYNDYTILTATNGWFREAQWREHSLPEVGIDADGILELSQGHTASQAAFSLSSHGSFSTSSYLPMGLLARKDGMDSWIWQIEHHGSWRWEVGDYKDSIYLSLSGPTSVDHGWEEHLEPEQSFTTVTCAVGRVADNWQAAFSTLTNYRRRIRRPHTDMENMPIIFNDYMNCLMGDPDEDKIKALLDPVVQCGAKYFVIDAGWYADDSNWWDDVGLWEPSKKRFPSGFASLCSAIRAKGLIPGVWVEPEVVGVRSVVGKRLSDKAFFQEHGQRIIERGRFQLDYRSAEVIKWMDSVIERLVVEYGVGYFKFDYNIEVVQGTDVDTQSPGAAHLEHQTAYLAWVARLLDRYPGLVIENCSSGGQRMDYGMLSVHPLQSTSDQQDPVLYASIAAAAPTAVTPEQSATWAYPQPEWSDEINALTVVNSLLGRVHLSGRLDNLKPHQLDLVRQGMTVYDEIKHQLKTAHAFWPLGLPKWHDDWVCLGMSSADCQHLYIAIWRRGGTSVEATIPLPKLFTQSGTVRATLLYPKEFEAEVTWKEDDDSVSVKLPATVCARLLHVSAASSASE